ncbi:MAG: hypothetical protein DA408_07250 [Bacteroidetes bacterium]|nr:MAG: hypothetical protein C7N36_13380 [Bacteroidota bacterium]PTM13295.1 MAG: hypothetical protein DA408_07250 [Bacteroidota bacterium]
MTAVGTHLSNPRWGRVIILLRIAHTYLDLSEVWVNESNMANLREYRDVSQPQSFMARGWPNFYTCLTFPPFHVPPFHLSTSKKKAAKPHIFVRFGCFCDFLSSPAIGAVYPVLL